MEGRKNYFEILKVLPFDPPEGNEKKIQKAIEEWYKDNTSSEDGCMPKQDADAIRADMLKVLKDPKARREEANRLIAERTAQLNAIIDIMSFDYKDDDQVEVTNGQIRNIVDKLKLREETVKEIYATHKNPTYVLKKKDKTVNITDFFLLPAIENGIKDRLKTLRETSNPQYSWTPNVYTLFDLLCFYDGGTDASKYWKKKTAELLTIAKNGHKEFALDNSSSGHAFKDVFSQAETQVFCSDDNRTKYENSLKKDKLASFFQLLKNTPDMFKKDSNFADNCIKTLQKTFGDYDLCLALYNKEAGLVKDPYEPVEAKIHVTCGKCNEQNEFRTIGEARKAVCQACGAKLYVSCPKCRNLIPNSAKRCPSCDFNINEMLFFDDYCIASENALYDYDFAEARKQYNKAENAYPGNQRLKTLKMAIDNAEREYNSSAGEVSKLIDEKKYCEADMKLQTLSREKPKLNLDKLKTAVRAKLAEVQRLMPPPTASPDIKGNRCIQILEMVCDYKPAVDMLKTCPLSKVRNLRCVQSGESCSLFWNASGDRDVSYTVVRKNVSAPLNHNDGIVLASNIRDRLEFVDSTIENGISYGYSVFASRHNIFSDPVSCYMRILGEPGNVRCSAESGFCRFTWELPKNSIGVRILRREKALPVNSSDPGVTVLTENALRYFDDRTVKNGITYGYCLQCVYPNGNTFEYSPRHTEFLTPEKPPVAVRNVSASVNSTTVSITWTSPDSTQRTLYVRELASSAMQTVRNTIGNVMSIEELKKLLKKDKTYVNALTTDCLCKFNIPVNTSACLAVVVVSGSNAVISNVLEVASVEKCEINKIETKIVSGRLKIVLDNSLASNLQRIHYFVGRKSGDTAPWMTADNARSGMMKVISAENYRKDGVIIVDNPPEDDLYISVIGEYNLGSKVAYSDSSKKKISNKPKSIITYYLTWKTGIFSKSKNCHLYVSSDAPETPEMKLVYRIDGRPPMNLTNNGIRILHVIPAMDNGFRHGEYTYEFSDKIWESVPAGAKIRLLMAEEDSNEYEIKPPVEGAEVPGR